METNLTLLNIFKYGRRQEKYILFASKLFVELQSFIARCLSSKRHIHMNIFLAKSSGPEVNVRRKSFPNIVSGICITIYTLGLQCVKSSSSCNTGVSQILSRGHKNNLRSDKGEGW
jgi:hypothetical protein